MMVLDIFAKAGTFCVEIYGILITLTGIEVFASWAKANGGRYVEDGGCHHLKRKLEGVGRTFLEVQRGEKHIFGNKEDQSSIVE